jgi:hypothetical protein
MLKMLRAVRKTKWLLINKKHFTGYVKYTYFRTQVLTQNFSFGVGADPEAIYNFFDFKNYATKIMF